jgi:hypothetical protein
VWAIILRDVPIPRNLRNAEKNFPLIIPTQPNRTESIGQSINR